MLGKESFLRRLARPLETQRSTASVIVAIVAQLFIVGIVDYATGVEVSVGIFYLFPVCVAAWFLNLRAATLVCICAAIIWLWADLRAGLRYSHWPIPYWNAIVRLGYFAIVALLLSRIRDLTKASSQNVQQKSALHEAEVKARQEIEARIVSIADEERRRLAHDLHDDIGQQLAAIALKAKTLELTSDTGPAKNDAAAVVASLKHAVSQIRLLARDFDAVAIEPHGLPAALEHLATFTEETFCIQCKVTVKSCSPAMSVLASTALYRVCQEAITNAVTHGRAKNVAVELVCTDAEASLSIQDDGIGFDLTRATAGMGLRIMKYRSERCGGKITIQSQPGTGTTVQSVLPLRSDCR